MQAWPNPVSGRAQISYSLSRPGSVNCAVYDAAGQLVTCITDGTQQAGRHTLAWDTGNARPGVYLLKLTGAVSQSLRLVRVAH